MSKLVVFGDSFASYRGNYNEEKEPVKGVVWFEEVAKKLNLSLENRAAAGSSFEFSKNQLWKYYNSSDYSQSDIIIFVFTSFGRSPILSSDIPPHYASYYTSYLQGNLKKDHVAYKHYNDHKEMYKSLAKFTTYDTQMADRHLFCLTLKQLPNTTIAITAFKDLYLHLKDKTLLEDSDNFVYIKGDLFDISTGELINADYTDFHKYFGGEVRNCHLSNSNNLIFANQIAQCIKHKSNKYFRKTEFKKKFIKLENINQTHELPYQEWKI